MDTIFTNLPLFPINQLKNYFCRATPETNRNLSINEMYMVDSGGQYLGGTTDVTRAIHCGEPTDFEKVVVETNNGVQKAKLSL